MIYPTFSFEFVTAFKHRKRGCHTANKEPFLLHVFDGKK